MKNFANNTVWRRAAMTLLLAVITITTALAQGNTLTMVNAKNTVWSNVMKLLYSESDSTGSPGFNFRSLFADDDSPGSSQMNADRKLSSISEPLSIEPPSIKSTFAGGGLDASFTLQDTCTLTGFSLPGYKCEALNKLFPDMENFSLNVKEFTLGGNNPDDKPILEVGEHLEPETGTNEPTVQSPMVLRGNSVTFSNLALSDGVICEGDVFITLLGTSYVERHGGPGITVSEGSRLTICGEGTLIVVGDQGCAAIGGGPEQNCGKIDIDIKGSLIATGGKYAAAIGSGKNGTCAKITIGNRITSLIAVGGENAEAIGSGENGTCGAISIADGLVDEEVDGARILYKDIDYDVWVGNTQVSATKCSNILGDGTASYDPETQTLTLDHPTTDFAIRSTGIDLTVKGYYKMTDAVGETGIKVEGGSLTLNGDFVFRGSSTGISAEGNVSVKGRVLAYGGSSAISQTGTLTLVPGFFAATRVEQYVGSGEPTVQTIAGTAIGDGTEGHPYEISSTSQWTMACEDVANGGVTAGKYFKLASGCYANDMMGTADNPFAGTIDGQRQYFYVQANIVTSKEGAALFPYVSGATIKNLALTGNIVGGNGSSGIVGKAVGGTTTIENCIFSGWVDNTSGEIATNWIVGAKAEGATVTTANCLNASVFIWGTGERAYGLVGSSGVTLTQVGTTGVRYGGVIWAPKDAVVSFNVSDYTDVVASSGSELSVNEGVYTITMPAEDVIIEPRLAAKRAVTVADGITGGTVTVNKATATEGSNVLITVTPDDYYLLKSLTVKDADDNEIAYDFYGFFCMPASPVTITAEFVKKYSFDSSTGVLTLMYGIFNNGEHGNFDTDITEHKSEVTKVAGAPGVRLNESVSGLFSGFINCTEIDLQYVETSTMTITSNMFGQCAALKKLNMNGWDTSNVTDMSNMFYGCGDLSEIDLSGFVFADGVNVSNMFQGCGVYKLTLPTGVGVTKEMQLNKGHHDNNWVYSGWQKLGDPTQTSTFEQDANDPDFSYAVLPAQTATSTFVWKEMPADFVLELPDGQDNRTLIELWDGMTVNVKLTGRTLYKDGEWNTLCLPLVSPGAQWLGATDLGKALGYDYEIKALTAEDRFNSAGQRYDMWEGHDEEDFPYQTGFNAETGELSIYFIPFYTMYPGAPYLIKWPKPDGYVAYDGTNAATCSDIVSPTFNGVTIDKTMNDVVSADGNVKFCGTYDNRYFPVANSSIYFMGLNNTIYYPGATAVVGPERAYFELSDPNAHVKRYAFNFGEDDVTAVAEKFNVKSSLSNDQWYTISGVKLNGKPNTKGVYINNGKKVVVK